MITGDKRNLPVRGESAGRAVLSVGGSVDTQIPSFLVFVVLLVVCPYPSAPTSAVVEVPRYESSLSVVRESG